MNENLPYYARVQQAVLAFVKDHPGVTLDGIIKRLSFDPHDITVAILELEKQSRIWSNAEKVDYSATLTEYYPA